MNERLIRSVWQKLSPTLSRRGASGRKCIHLQSVAGIDPPAAQPPPGSKLAVIRYWVLATLAEAHIGLEEEALGQRRAPRKRSQSLPNSG